MRSNVAPSRPALHRLQAARQNQRVDKTILRIFFQELMDDPRQLGGRLGSEPRDGLGLGIALKLQHLDQRLGTERRPTSQQGIENASQTVLIATVGHGPPLSLLGRHVFSGSQHASVTRQPGVSEQPRNAEVGELDIAVRGEQ